MTYPGNPSLPSDVQQRIRSTFDHTLGLAEGGSRQEALLGCDFVLRMDPLFEPARRLQERLEAGNGSVAVDDLRVTPAITAGPAAPAASVAASSAGRQAPSLDPLWPDLDGLAIELPDLPEAHSGAPAPVAGAQDLRGEFEALLAERRFQELQLRAGQVPAVVAGDLELQRIVALAQERLEAGPYVSKFLQSAREALRTGGAADARRLLEKAKTLDPTHPGIADLEALGSGRVGTLYQQPELQTQQITRSASTAAATPPMPSVPAPAPTPHHGVGDSDSERRIQQLLDEGQAALDGGDPQAAIDAWSRIFLIDIDHQEAARRIESARRMKAERDRQVEEAFHDGLGHLEAKDAAAARAAFQRVLELQPAHLQSREYLQQLDDGIIPVPTSAARAAGAHTGSQPAHLASGASPAGSSSPDPLAPPPPMASAQDLGLPTASIGAAGAGQAPAQGELKEEILVPPDLDQAGARTAEPRREVRSASTAAQEGRARRLFLVVGSAVLLLALAVGWFLYQKREQWFPNSRSEEAVQPPAPNPIPRATKLHDSGKIAIAIAQLRRLAPSDPHYKEAQGLIAKWQAEQTQSAQAAQGPPGAAGSPSAQPGSAGLGSSTALPAGAAPAITPEAARRQELLAEAQKAFQNGAFLRAAERYEAAGRLAKLDAGDAAQLLLAKQKLIPIQRQIAMFRSHDWEFVLPDLWRLRQADPGNRDVHDMIVDSYYDLGVRDLQHEDVAKAAEKFTEAVKLAPDDAEVKRQLLFVQSYQDRGHDLLYQIYVKYLIIR